MILGVEPPAWGQRRSTERSRRSPHSPFYVLSLPTSLKKLGECPINALDLALAPFSCMPERL